jgi:hypothetical protein
VITASSSSAAVGAATPIDIIAPKTRGLNAHTAGWSEDDIKRLKRLWAKGTSATLIGDQIGGRRRQGAEAVRTVRRGLPRDCGRARRAEADREQSRGHAVADYGKPTLRGKPE